MSPLLDPALSPSWQSQPLLVSASGQRFGKLDMCATLLTNCQVWVAARAYAPASCEQLLPAAALLLFNCLCWDLSVGAGS